ncbi:hypothetical protein [Duganella sp. LjRoot269]|uniref:hypothetical protein n=1 Tax=Duganella sp. LjRoot269 TaxID=3342305 RepID=UPI003ED0311B
MSFYQKKSTFFFTAVALTVVFLVLWASKDDQNSDTPKPIYRITSQPVVSTKIAPAPTSSTRDVSGECKAPSFYGSDVSYSTPSSDSSASDIVNSYKNIDAILSKKEKDPISNIILFKLISYCPSSNADECPTINPKSLYKDTPIELLEKAAELGSVEAKLMYALNAPLAEFRIRKSRPEDGELLARKITLTAERLGNEAARSGNLDAIRYMSHSYENGQFGFRDIERAYSVALPLLNSSVEDIAYVDALQRKLNPLQRNAAVRFAFGCKEEIGRKTVSPFSKN